MLRLHELICACLTCARAGGLRKLGPIDWAAVFLFLAQFWSGLSGLLTVAVVAARLGVDEQGYYYTFGSVLAMQVFVELGLATVLVQFASHEWSHLKLAADGTIVGQMSAISRLASLLKFAVKWYIVAGFLLSFALALCGGFVFSGTKSPSASVHWQMPWLVLCLVVGSALTLTPFFAILEGCGQIVSVSLFRLLQAFLGSIAILLCFWYGIGLYSVAVGAAVRLFVGLIFVLIAQRRFISTLLWHHVIEKIAWKDSIWPFQWRIAVSWLSGYFIYSLFTPVMFMYHGAVVAGQMGMTLTLVGAIETLAYPWVLSKAPQFGALIATNRYVELDSLFRRRIVFALSVGIAVGVAVISVRPIAGWLGWRVEGRLLGWMPLLVFVFQRMLIVSASAIAVYVRAHKRDPLMIPSVVSALLIGVLTFVLGKPYGPEGVAVGYLAVTVFWILPASCWVFARVRREWHVPDSVPLEP